MLYEHDPGHVDVLVESLGPTMKTQYKLQQLAM